MEAGGRESTAVATLRIVERANSGRSLCLSHEVDGCQDQKALPAGTTVLSEKPLVNLATDGDCCDRCMATGLIGQAAVSRRRYRCQACGLNHCSERCRKRHDADECAAFVAIDSAIGRQHPRNNWLRLVARTCLCVQTRKMLPSFCHHAEDRGKAADDAALLSRLLVKCRSNHAVGASSNQQQPHGQQVDEKELAMVDTSEQLIVTCWCVLRCNLLTIHDDAERCGERHLGWGLYHLGSLFNHSCAPNVEWHHRGAQLVVNCLEDLVPGTELSISYVDLASGSFWTQDNVNEGRWPRESITARQQYMSRVAMMWSEKVVLAGTRRREKLFRDYHFRCDCCRCTGEINMQQRRQGATEYRHLNQFWREFQNSCFHELASYHIVRTFFALLLAAMMADFASASGHEAGDQMQDGLAPIVALLYEQGVQIPCADLGSHDRHWGDYLLQVACRIQELRRIHPPNGTFQVALHCIYHTCMSNNQALFQGRLVAIHMHMHCSVGNCLLPGQACDESTHEAALGISGKSSRGSFAIKVLRKGPPAVLCVVSSKHGGTKVNTMLVGVQESGQPAADLMWLAMRCALVSLNVARGSDHPICIALAEWIGDGSQTDASRRRPTHENSDTGGVGPAMPEVLEQMFSEFKPTGWRRVDCTGHLAFAEKSDHGQQHSKERRRC